MGGTIGAMGGAADAIIPPVASSPRPGGRTGGMGGAVVEATSAAPPSPAGRGGGIGVDAADRVGGMPPKPAGRDGGRGALASNPEPGVGIDGEASGGPACGGNTGLPSAS